MEKNEYKKIEFFYKNHHLGTLFDKDENGFYTYCSDKVGEDEVLQKYFLPKEYEDEMLNSIGENGTKSKGFTFVSEVSLRLDRPDLKKMLQIDPSDNDFDKLFKLASRGEFIGENIQFSTELSGEKREEPCQPQI